MRITELVHSPINTPEANLTTALELLRNRYSDDDQTPVKVKTQSVINLVLNTDKTFNYDALVAANNNNPAVKNIIKSFNKDYVELRPTGDDATDDLTTTNPDEADPTKAPVDTVGDMAVRAGKRRDSDIF